MRIVLVINSLFLSLIGLGCSTTLTREGSQVAVVESLPAGRQQYRALGIVTCQHEQNLASVGFNRRNCLVSLRNRAAEKGARVVVLDAEEIFPGTATVGVFMIGLMYSEVD